MVRKKGTEATTENIANVEVIMDEKLSELELEAVKEEELRVAKEEAKAKAVKIVEEKRRASAKAESKRLQEEAKKLDKRGNILSNIMTANPYTKERFEKNEVSEDVLIDSWVRCQIAAGIMEEC